MLYEDCYWFTTSILTIERKCVKFRRLWIFLVLYITIPVRDLLSEFKHRLFKICLFLNWAPDHTDFAVDIQVQGERTIARFEVCKCYCVKGGKGSLDYTYIYNHHIKNENKCNGYCSFFFSIGLMFNLLKVEVVKYGK